MPPATIIPFPNRTARMSAPGAHAPQPQGHGGNVIDLNDHQLRELSLDLLGFALDLAGIVDPTPVSDGASALLSISRGQWFDAIISGASMLPYVGDLAKAGKLPKYLRTVENAIRMAQQSEKVAHALTPALRKLKDALDLLPRGANAKLDQIRGLIDSFLRGRGIRSVSKLLPDISKRFRHYTETVGTLKHQISEGWLGVPGKVKRHRSSYQQGKVSKGTGDDAGHQIGDRFGARGDKQNLTQQNWIANRGQGTFYALEKEWEELLLKGNKVKVKVTDVFDAGAVRPKYRKVEWIVVAPDGFNKTSHKLDFMNTHTDKSRAATGWTNPFPPGHQAKVIPIDRGK